MSIPSEHKQSELPPAGRIIAAASARPRQTTAVLTLVLVLSGWVLTYAMSRSALDVVPLQLSGPGSVLLKYLPDLPLPSVIERWFAICFQPNVLSAGILAEYFSVVLMLFVMAVAVMTPSAAPMLRTYCDIAETAANKGENVVHPAVLLAGYLSTWAVAALLLGLHAVAWRGGLRAFSGPADAPVAAAALALAGAYQFTPLKHACLKKCANPFSVLFSQWSDRAAKIFILGLRQGLYCLGCCWALMLIMVAVGTFNFLWMALLAAFFLWEKINNNRLVEYSVGAFLIAWAAGLLFLH